MTWSGASDFLAMGGYAVYVWGSYGVAAACLLADPLLAAHRHRRAMRLAGNRDGDDPADADVIPAD